MPYTYILNINHDLGKGEFTKLFNLISDDKRKRILKFIKDEDIQRSLLGDVLVRYAICRKFGVQNKDLLFSFNEYGKPVLLKPGGIHFNISHSGNWVACTIDNYPVGIDVETIKIIDFKIAERFFSEDEYTSLINQPEELRLRYFYMLWTLKESYIKAEGKGLSIPLNSFSICIDNNNIYLRRTSNHRLTNYYFQQFFLNDNAICGICSINVDNINYYFTLNQIINKLLDI